MTLRPHHFISRRLPLLTGLFLAAAGALAGPTNSPAGKTNAPAAAHAAPAEAPITPSIFLTPGPGNPGKDPFFPRSVRIDPVLVAPTNAPATFGADLVLSGISGTPARPLAIINTRTFSPGEDGEVPTATGARVRLLCVEINFQQQTALVEVAGARRELKFRGRK